ncbi:MAG: hypothetical protein ABIH89_08390 [Elusimicrobiota bacterium]
MHRRISEILNVEFERKTPVFLYYDHNHFEQNRIAAAETGVEGFSEFFKNRLVIPVSYSRYDMTHLIAHEYVHITQFEILHGGFWKSARLVKTMSGLVPLWIMEGMAESVSHSVLDRPWSSYDRMILRDAVMYDRLYNIRELQNFNALYRDVYLAYKEGHSAVDFLVKNEGEDIHFKLLKALRNNMDPVKAFETAAATFASMNDFDIKWRKDLKKRVDEFIRGKDFLCDVSDIEIADKYHSRNPVPAGADSFYYISDRWLKNEIYLHKNKKDKRILKDFFTTKVRWIVSGRIYDRTIDYNRDSEMLVFAFNEKQKEYLALYNSRTEKLEKIYTGLNEPRSPALSPDSRSIVFTALQNGARNIYVYIIASGKTVRLTNDSMIDYAPVFSPDGNAILVSTERNMNTDMRLVDINTGNIRWLTETPANEIHAIYDSAGDIIFSSDRNSVYNLCRYEISKSTSYPLTNVREGIFAPGQADDGKILASCYYDGSFKILSFNRLDAKPATKNERDYIDMCQVPPLEGTACSTGDFRKRFSTDFFFPSFLYSTDIGFIGGGYYRASDILGQHSIDILGWVWPGTYDISAGYSISKWRPDMTIRATAAGEEYIEIDELDNEFEKSEYYNGVTLGIRYPVDSYISLSNWYTAAGIDEKDETAGTDTHETETGAGIGIARETALLEPFNVLRGSLFSLSAYAARPLEKRGVTYNRYECMLRKYIPFSHRLTWASRMFLARVEGEDRKKIELGTSPGIINIPAYTLRGYGGSMFSGDNLLSLSNEVRFMLVPHIGGHIYFMWPDLNIYSLSLKLFTDAGTCWDDVFPQTSDKIGASWGFGFNLNLYLVQLAPIFISAEFARPYDRPDWKSYWMLSSGYITW